MKKETLITFILDRSGSMSSIKNDMIGGFNSFIEEQKKIEGKCRVSLVQFDDEYEVVYNQIPLKKVPELKLVPRGRTALMDAIGKTISELGTRLRALPESERAEKVLIIVLTDGYENASREYTRSAIKEMISHQQEKYSWDFIFLGANIDAVQEGQMMGLVGNRSVNFVADSYSVGSTYSVLSEKVAAYRNPTLHGLGASIALDFTEEDKLKIKK